MLIMPTLCTTVLCVAVAQKKIKSGALVGDIRLKEKGRGQHAIARLVIRTFTTELPYALGAYRRILYWNGQN